METLELKHNSSWYLKTLKSYQPTTASLFMCFRGQSTKAHLWMSKRGVCIALLFQDLRGWVKAPMMCFFQWVDLFQAGNYGLIKRENFLCFGDGRVSLG